MAQQKGPTKVLRIGVIQDNKLVHDRTLRAGEPVSIGESSKNTFVFPKLSLRSQEFVLFRATQRGYVLQVTEQMMGKVDLGGGSPVQLRKLLEDPSVERQDGLALVPITDQARGQIELDSVKILFRFVSPPPPKAALPDFRPRMLEEDDPVFLGFLGLWTMLGIVLAIWVWLTPPREFTLDDLPERYVKIIAEPKPPTPQPGAEVGRAAEKKAEPEPETAAQKEMKGAKSEAQKAKAEQARKSEIIAGSSLLLKFVGTAGESKGGVVQRLWDEGGLGNAKGSLEDAAGTTGSAAEAGMRVGGDGAGKEAAGIGGIDQIGGGKGTDVSGPKVTVKPKVSTGSGSVDTVSGDDNQVKSTVTRYAGQLQYCYEKLLKLDPELEGRVEVSWSVAGGLVTGMPVTVSNSTSNAELADCIVKKIRRWEFPPDVEGDMSWPFLFQRK